VIFLLSK